MTDGIPSGGEHMQPPLRSSMALVASHDQAGERPV
jgi:hypothetical protein